MFFIISLYAKFYNLFPALKYPSERTTAAAIYVSKLVFNSLGEMFTTSRKTMVLILNMFNIVLLNLSQLLLSCCDKIFFCELIISVPFFGCRSG